MGHALPDCGMADNRTPLADIAAVNSEHQMLGEFLDYFRTVMLRKVEGLDEAEVRVTVAASTIDLLGLVRHLADVERWWFRVVFGNEAVDGIYETPDDADADWHHHPTDTMGEALEHWHREVGRAREILASTTDLDSIAARVSARRGRISMRWIMIHMIEEYARHVGHADFLRENIDGTTGD